MKKLALALIIIFSLTACGSKFEGSYSTGDGQTYFNFTSDGKVVTNSMLLLVSGIKPEGRFKKEANKTKMYFSDKNGKEEKIIWSLNDSGSINAEIFGVLTKK